MSYNEGRNSGVGESLTKMLLHCIVFPVTSCFFKILIDLKLESLM